MTTLIIRSPIAVAPPRAAAWAAAAWIAAVRSGARLQALFSRAGERGGVTGRVSEANRLRAAARGFLSSDPRFAADMFAAADRHERAD